MRYGLTGCMLLAVLAGCTEPTDGEHVWKTQTDMIDKARDTGQLIDAARERHDREIEEASR